MPERGARPLFGPGICAQATGLPDLVEARDGDRIQCRSGVDAARRVRGEVVMAEAAPGRRTVTHRFHYDWMLKGSRCTVTLSGRWTLTGAVPDQASAPPPPSPAVPSPVAAEGPRRRSARRSGAPEPAPDLAAAHAKPEEADVALPPQRGAGLTAAATPEAPAASSGRVLVGVFIGFAVLATLAGLWLALRAFARRNDRLLGDDTLARLEQAERRAAPAGGATAPIGPARRPVMVCPECERTFDEASRYCPFDAHALERHLALGTDAATTARVCPTCSGRHPTRTTHCPRDGTPLLNADGRPATARPHARICPSCGARYGHDTRYCGLDGTELVLLN